MRVYKRGPGWWADFAYTDAQGQEQRWRRSLKLPAATPKREVQARAEEIRKGLHALTTLQEHGVYLPLQEQHDAPCPFSGLAKLWLDHQAPHVKRSTLHRYKQTIRLYLAPRFGDHDARTITSLDVRALQSDLASKGYGGNTINHAIARLVGILSVGVEGGWLASNVALKAPRIKIQKEAWDWYTQEETTIFLATVQRTFPHWYPMVLLGFRAGLRPGELLALRWDDVDLRLGEIVVRRTLTIEPEGTRVGSSTKTSKNRRVPLTADAREVLLQNRSLDEQVFASFAGKTTRHNGSLRYVLRRAALAAGMRALRPQDMRHSFASQLISQGVSLKIVAELLGHSSTQTTERFYAHLAPSSLKAAVEHLMPKAVVA